MIKTKNEWSELSDLLSNLIAKYAEAINIDSLPEPIPKTMISDEIKRAA